MPVRGHIRSWIFQGNDGANIGGGETCSGEGQAFDGGFEYLYYADNGALDVNQASSDFCFSAFVKTGSDISSTQYICGKPVSAVYQGKYSFLVSGGSLRANILPTGGGVTVLDSIVAATNTWYHLLARVDLTGSRIYFYIDGVLQNSGGTAFTGTFSTMDNAYEFLIGAAYQSGAAGISYYFGGSVKDVRVYHKNVVPDLVDLMDGKSLGDEKVWYCLSNGTFTDLSGNGYNLSGTIGADEPADNISSNYTRLTDFFYRMQQGSLTNDGTDLYFIGGQHYDSQEESTKLAKYTVANGEWSLLTSKPGLGYQSLGFVHVGGKLYHVGGLSGGVTDELYEYEISTDTWTELTSMPTPREDFACVADGQYIYVIGGWDASNIRAEVEVFDTVAGTWDATRTDIPTPVCLGNIGAIDNGYIYVISGVSDMSSYPEFTSILTVQRYNISTDTWDTVADINEGGSYLECAVDSGKIYVLGGVVSRVSSTNQTLSNKLKIYDIATNTWSYDADDFKDIRGYGATILNSKLYIATGNYSEDSVYPASNRFYEKDI